MNRKMVKNNGIYKEFHTGEDLGFFDSVWYVHAGSGSKAFQPEKCCN